KVGIELPIIRATALTLPSMENSFDTVVATFPTDYIFEPETLRAIRRVLVPQGRLVIVPSGELKGNGVLEWLIGLVFALTGHGGEDFSAETTFQKWHTYFTTQHFNLTIQPVEFAKSYTTILIAQAQP
ncbi:MAG TPA: methyltransferase domain-containing protein, partial [Anaerolineae bacterium]|nr:methyltransferase domain-containing protein [Anaerolineae bacterium]